MVVAAAPLRSSFAHTLVTVVLLRLLTKRVLTPEAAGCLRSCIFTLCKEGWCNWDGEKVCVGWYDVCELSQNIKLACMAA